MMKLALVLFSFSFMAFTPELEKLDPSDFELLSAVNHSSWDMILQKHVSTSGKVDYESLKTNPNLSRYLSILKAANPDDASWSENDKKAFWINAYNAFTVRLILDNYPVKSINDISKPWDKKFIVINGKNYSLNQIENDILRPKFKDARVHFAINCASISCPKLHNKAFTKDNLESKLETLTKAFVNNSSMNELSADAVKVSKIFDWYGVDFKTDGTLIDWLNKYSNTSINSDAKVSYKSYNWNLNKK